MLKIFSTKATKYIFIFLAGVMACLNGCSGHTALPTTTPMFLSPTRQISTTQMRSLTAKLIKTSSIPTFDPSFVFGSSTRNEFEKSDSILFSYGPGSEVAKDIYDMGADGSGFTCITCNTRQELEGRGMISVLFDTPAWSTDGSMYAYAFFSDQKEIILVREKNSNNDVELLSGRYTWYDSLSWSPDGKYIAFSTYDHDKGEDIICYIEVNLTNPENAKITCLGPEKVNGNSSDYPSWSPDGKSIIFSVGDSLFVPNGQPTDLYRWDLESQSVSQITDTPEFEILPQWSPDGSKFAYVQVSGIIPDWKYTLWIMNADGTGKTHIDGDDNILDFGWSPDGKKIVFTVEVPNSNDQCDAGCLPYTILKIIDLETGNIAVFSDGKQWIGDPSWRPHS